MIYKVCSIYDKGIEGYMRPFFVVGLGQAMRMFEDLVKDPEHDISKHPEDYSLFEIASFDDRTASLDAIEPHCLARAHELKQLSKLKEVQ